MKRVRASSAPCCQQGAVATRALFALGFASLVSTSREAFAASAGTLAPHIEVDGADVVDAEVRRAPEPWKRQQWAALGQTRLTPGPYEVRVRFPVPDGESAVSLPACADRRSVSLDGRKVAEGPAPMAFPVATGWHDVVLTFAIGTYERRVACGEPPRVGRVIRTTEGLGLLRFDSPYTSRGGGEAVVYIPPGHDVSRPGPVLVGTHPWNGSIWTYAAYAELIREARAHDVLLLMPSGLGNSLYTADAEDEVLRALDALASVTAVEPRAISIWGASMGGAGATTIGFHHPDRFASVTSFFGDSRYDLSTYVRRILPDEPSAHRVNALDVVDNARHVPVWLVHGQEDRTSPIAQSQELANTLRQHAFQVRFDAVPGVGHAGALVARYLPELVALASRARVPDDISRVTYRSVRPSDLGAYGVELERSQARGDAFVDVELAPEALHVRRAEGVSRIWVTPGALGTDKGHLPPIELDTPNPSLTAIWGTR
jgi:pimeloyl-ACP methyl ester carboxylesterase